AEEGDERVVVDGERARGILADVEAQREARGEHHADRGLHRVAPARRGPERRRRPVYRAHERSGRAPLFERLLEVHGSRITLMKPSTRSSNLVYASGAASRGSRWLTTKLGLACPAVIRSRRDGP